MMMQRWIGRVALVTGAASGIGKATSMELVKHGMKVVGCDYNQEGLDSVKAELEKDVKGSFHPVQCDLRDESQIMKMFADIKENLGGVDVCANVAGIGYPAPLLSGETSQWTPMWQINVMAYLICARESVKSMEERGIDDGHIILMGSIRGQKVRPCNMDMNFYNACKFAVRAINDGIRNELHKKGSKIRTTLIGPGKVDTNFTIAMYPPTGKPPVNEKKLDGLDIANAIVYALSQPPHVQVHDMTILATDEPSW